MASRAALLLIVLAFVAGLAVLEELPAFDMDYCADRAERIVVGKLDEKGTLTAETALKGARPDAPVALDDGPRIYSKLREGMKTGAGTAIPAVAFLDKGTHPVRGWAGVVGLSEDGVFVHKGGSSEGDSPLVGLPMKHPTHTRESFLAAVKAALQVAQERRELCALPPSADRAKKLLAFLFEHGRPFRAPAEQGGRSSYHVGEVARALAPARPDEQRAILDALEGAKDAAQRLLLLDLAREIPLRADAMPVLARFIRRDQPPEVRDSAIWGLSRIDTVRALDYFLPLLSLDDPQVGSLLSAMGSGSDPPQGGRLSPQAVGVLLRLTQELRQRHKEQGRTALYGVSQSLAYQLRRHAHPLLLAALFDWAMADDHVSCNRALQYLQEVSGLKLGRDERAAWDQWLQKATAAFTAPYALGEPKGLSAWCDAYQGADPAARRMLVRLWFFESSIDENALVERCADARHGDAPKAALAELWQAGRLSPEARKAIVARFLSPKLIEVPSSFPGRIELQVKAAPQFPFPKDSWVQNRCQWLTGERVFPPGDGWGSFSLADAGRFLIGSYGGPAIAPASITAVLALREVDPRKGSQVLWEHRWALRLPPRGDPPKE